MQRILNGRLWSFDNCMFILGSIYMGDIPSQVPLFHINISVQGDELPSGFMSPIKALHLGNYIGEYLDYDPNNDRGVRRMYMRVRVKVDVGVPLKNEKKIKKPSGRMALGEIQV